MAGKIRWGILGCGKIAARFAEDLNYSKYGQAAAVGSRSARKARTFAESFKVSLAYGSYEKLVRDNQIDIVYVATPHPFHMENTLLSLEAGKPVLCEKPVSMNARQLRRMMAAAEKKKLFFMEGMWTRFFPAVGQVQKWIADGRIGTVLHLEADFGVSFKVGPLHRLRNPHLGGGALLDLGIYIVSFASMVFGRQPQRITSRVHKEKTGVDDQSVLIFEYPGGAQAVLSCGSRLHIRPEARIYGTRGTILVHENFYRPNRLTLTVEGRNPELFAFPHPGLGFQFEADHVAECLRTDKRQSPLMPPAESMAIMQTMDKIRRQWKLRYPCE